MAVPLLDFQRQHAPLRNGLDAAYDRVMSSGQYIFGPEVEAFEREIAEYLEVPHAVSLSSGTDALLVAMMALGIGPGDEVLCPAFTFFGTAGAVVRLGATPVWVDVLPDTFNIDLADAARKAGPATKAIIPVHLFGQPCDMDCLAALAKKFGLHVIEDAAQAVGARYGGRRVGSFGSFGAFSFYPTKNLGAFGDAGLLVTNDGSLAERAKHLRNHGMHPKYHHNFVGGNFRMDALQAALLRVKLPHLDAYHSARRAHAAFYNAALSGVEELSLPMVHSGMESVWNQYTVRVGGHRRDALRAFLGVAGIGSEIYYPVPLHEQPCFAGTGRGGEDVPVSLELSRGVVSIPVFPELTDRERAEVVAAVRRFFEEG
ncbi:MAG: DegT/DnrJ/EryC1/StrS family aminotransferase [Opitutales bacterium]|nr:DegT/DnrJ/EryC1/StrS family aminotransferase [Opitutales bacterium]